MNATLDEMILFTARQTKRTEDVVKTGGVYTEDALEIVNKFIDGFNYAKSKICKERHMPLERDTITVGGETALVKDIYKVKSIKLAGTQTEVTDWEIGPGLSIEFPDSYNGLELDIEYYYMIPDFPNNPTATELQLMLAFPEAIVDFRILCFYACYEYHLIKGSDRDLDKTGFFLSKWNDGYLHIPKTIKGNKTVKNRARY